MFTWLVNFQLFKLPCKALCLVIVPYKQKVPYSAKFWWEKLWRIWQNEHHLPNLPSQTPDY